MGPALGIREIIERAHALLALRDDRAAPGPLAYGAVALDPARRAASVFGDPVELTRAQFDILAILVRAGGCVVTKEDLQRGVWPDAPVDDGQRLLAHVRRIRARIEPNPARPTVLLTARGVGFRIADRSEAGSPARRRAHLRVADAPD
jgi:two-component system response regulator RegX3